MDEETKRIRERFNIKPVNPISNIDYNLPEFLQNANKLAAPDEILKKAGDLHACTVNTARALHTDRKRVQIGAPYNNKALPSTAHIIPKESTQISQTESLKKGNRQLIVIIATIASLCCVGSILADSLLNKP